MLQLKHLKTILKKSLQVCSQCTGDSFAISKKYLAYDLLGTLEFYNFIFMNITCSPVRYLHFGSFVSPAKDQELERL